MDPRTVRQPSAELVAMAKALVASMDVEAAAIEYAERTGADQATVVVALLDLVSGVARADAEGAYEALRPSTATSAFARAIGDLVGMSRQGVERRLGGRAVTQP